MTVWQQELLDGKQMWNLLKLPQLTIPVLVFISPYLENMCKFRTKVFGHLPALGHPIIPDPRLIASALLLWTPETASVFLNAILMEATTILRASVSDMKPTYHPELSSEGLLSIIPWLSLTFYFLIFLFTAFLIYQRYYKFQIKDFSCADLISCVLFKILVMVKEIHIFIVFYYHSCCDKDISLAETEIIVKATIGLGKKEKSSDCKGSCLSEVVFEELWFICL